MVEPRLIPVLTYIGEGLYRTVRFRKPSYVGDPINTVRLFNDKEVDELIVADISPDRRLAGPDFDLLEKLATEAFMPMAYAGKLTETAQVDRIFRIGFEKVVFNTSAIRNLALIEQVARTYGSQACVVSVDVGKPRFGVPQVLIDCGRSRTGLGPALHVQRCQDAGAGELLIRSIERDGTMGGYDLELTRSVASVASVPVVALGGAGSLDHVSAALAAGAHSAAAGSMFVYHGRHRAVLVSYPERERLNALFAQASPVHALQVGD